MVALGFVLAAAAEAVLRYHDTVGLLVFNASGAVWLGALALRRSRPLMSLGIIAAGALFGTVAMAVLWPNADDGGGVWIVAMMLASYSLGAHGSRRVVAFGALLPMLVVAAADTTSMSGWDRLSGIVFAGLFGGLFPTLVGHVVRIRNERLRVLRSQHARIVHAQRAQQESAVLAERLRIAERLQPTLIEGLNALAVTADAAGDPAGIEASARSLLSRTREEVAALSAPVEETHVPTIPVVDHVAALRAAAQPWAVIAAGAVVTGLFVETSSVLDLSAPGWLVLPAALLVGAPLALAWRRPVASVALAWLAAAAFSRLVAPLDGSLSGAGFVLVVSFAVAVLSRRRAALFGLVVCWLGDLVAVGAGDPLSVAILVLLAWLGGLAVNEASRLVEQTLANNEMLGRQEAASAVGALVEERMRLAREVHDAIGHSLTVVALQAGAARRLAATDPGRVREVMRTVAAAARGGVASLALDHSRADITSMVERVRATGLALDADVADETLLEPVQQVIAFRIVQEGLTNVLRHAPGSRASVTVRGLGDVVEVVIANSAPTSSGSGPGTGRGLAGIRERVGAGGGQVSWGKREDGGFEMRAFLPRLPVVAPAI
jgi:signal transduction histidine kinase